MKRFNEVKYKLIKIIESCQDEDQIDMISVFTLQCLNNPKWLKRNCSSPGLAIQMQYYVWNALKRKRFEFYGEDDVLHNNDLDRITF
jgi:hypothetical protein